MTNPLAEVRGLAWEGGGVRAFSYMPVLKYLEAQGVMPRVRYHAGTSAGAIVASLSALGARSGFITKLLATTDWPKVFGARRWWGAPVRAVRCWRKKGMFTLDGPKEWIAQQIQELGWPERVTFRDVRGTANQSLYIPATDEGLVRPVMFCAELTPSVAVADAVIASMAIPIYYEPFLLGGRTLSDGGSMDNYPIAALRDIAKLPVNQILGARVDAGYEVSNQLRPVGGFMDRVQRIIDILSVSASRAHVDEELWRRTIRINTRSVKATEFGLSREAIDDLMRWGEEGLQQFIANTVSPASEA